MTAAIHRQAAGWRVTEGITQKEIARAVGLSPESISAWEHGRTKNQKILLEYLKRGFKPSYEETGE